ncbi:hypothetical protein DMH03_27295 [Amycolatopsis sp. WAC 01376]|uniref:hypothetical protein n=1 Tax=Amycolatopsis sp. WAC 01376 TaxID=2203195 RepID=UPI000F78BD9A|nr:hypothetical protein [Amycolatopsis sp. WAC 01376]RSM56978.1 hypothetical protein DMH03_27295 [Amycolatopsis sp. WAC 01376]
MSTEDRVSLPLGFDIPEGWVPVEPSSVGADGAVFVAVHSAPDGEFTPNITLSVGQRPDRARITDIADEAVERLGRSMAALELVRRKEIGTPVAPGVTQVLRIRTGEGQDLVQTQVQLTVPGASPADRLILQIACTATPEAARGLGDDFRRFVGSVHVRRDATADEGEDS